ncbi:MAG: putative hydrolase [Parcubacteria group bacterium LiPW_39]|nr:MAG: putative hydrolase [Parcubacteria group bacterium LiPW_39]
MLKIDLHTHTIASGHGFNTILEMAKEASKRGIKILGISEHGPAVPGSATITYFNNLERPPRKLFGVKVLYGAELNIINGKGGVDLPEKCLKEKLDFVSFSFHENCGYEDKGEEMNTETLLKALNNPYISILTHIYRTKFPINVAKVAQAACDKNKLLEISTTHFEYNKLDEERWVNLLKMIEVAKKNKCKILLGSDAHVFSEIGVDKNFQKNKKKLDLTDKDIANNDIRYLRKFIKNI